MAEQTPWLYNILLLYIYIYTRPGLHDTYTIKKYIILWCIVRPIISISPCPENHVVQRLRNALRERTYPLRLILLHLLVTTITTTTTATTINLTITITTIAITITITNTIILM